MESARVLGVNRILIPGTSASCWHKQIALCSPSPQLEFALGLHPYFLEAFFPQQLEQLSELIQQHRNQILAVGEIGLDFAIQQDKSLQLEVFESQLELAKYFELPVILHHRKSHHEIIRLLKQHKVARGGVVHAYSGSYQQAMEYVELGFKLGIGGTITYPRANKTIDAVKRVPLSSLLLETDAPDMPVSGKQGKRNSPENLPVILDVLAQIRDEPREEIEKTTDLNFAALFQVDLQPVV